MSKPLKPVCVTTTEPLLTAAVKDKEYQGSVKCNFDIFPSKEISFISTFLFLFLYSKLIFISVQDCKVLDIKYQNYFYCGGSHTLNFGCSAIISEAMLKLSIVLLRPLSILGPSQTNFRLQSYLCRRRSCKQYCHILFQIFHYFR